MGIFHNLMKSSSDCMCFSMDTSAVVHAQVISVKHEKLRGSNMHTDDSVVDYRLDSKAKHASVLKRGFSGPSICKRYARVSDVSDSKRQETLLIADANDNGVEKDETADEEVQREQTGGDDHDESLHRAYRLSTKDYSSVRKLMQNYHPTVRYTYEPCMAFYESMMETIKVGCVEGYEYLDLADMFTCYLMLNSSQHHRHIEEAFRLLLRELYIFAET
ncbi:hypothetical protein KP509_02G052100 [Ceratopteris richardii]|nr:hypothetical protein KP509_02G052100 [Ceratopteris richardii]